MKKKSIAAMRQDYRSKTFDIQDVSKNPMDQFKKWFNEAVTAEILEPNAMTLATVSKTGLPACRIVLLKGYDEKGFIFYTNYNSRKAQELATNPHAALGFVWLPMARQIRIGGKVEKITAKLSNQYFQKRPKESQIGAWASPQSQVIENRQVLIDNFQQLTTQYKDIEKIERPPHWGGYRVIPDRIEFWQGRTSRLHDRIRYKLQTDGSWTIERLAP